MESDTFTFNGKFRSKLYKIKITTVTGPEKKEEAAESRIKIDEDRKHQYVSLELSALRSFLTCLALLRRIEAAIVRIMKSRKNLEHNNLIAEVSSFSCLLCF